MARIFTSFLIVLIDIFLWILPYQPAIYDFRTYEQIDEFTVATAVGVTADNVTLSKELYDNDTQTIVLNSDLATDSPILSTYNATTRVALVTGFTDNTTRTLEVLYDAPAFDESGALSTFMDNLPYFWMLVLALFPPAAIAYIWWGKIRKLWSGGED